MSEEGQSGTEAQNLDQLQLTSLQSRSGQNSSELECVKKTKARTPSTGKSAKRSQKPKQKSVRVSVGSECSRANASECKDRHEDDQDGGSTSEQSSELVNVGEGPSGIGTGVDSIVNAMKAGFNEITDMIQARKTSKRGKSPLRVSSSKRARHEDMSDSSVSEQDVEEDIDNLLKPDSADKEKADKQENDDIFCELEEEYDLEEKCGPLVQEKLAGIVNKMARTKLNDDLLKEKLNKFNRPKNCDKLVATKVNPEIWGKITSNTRSRDVKFQKVQAVLLKAISGLTHVADKLSQTNKEATKDLLHSIALITHANCDLNHRRRDLIKPDLNRSYQQICSDQVQATDLLFGDDLPQKIKDINTTNRVGNRLLDNPKQYKTSYYGHESHKKSGYPKNGQRTAWRGGYQKKWNNHKYHSYPQKKKEEGRGEK